MSIVYAQIGTQINLCSFIYLPVSDHSFCEYLNAPFNNEYEQTNKKSTTDREKKRFHFTDEFSIANII